MNILAKFSRIAGTIGILILLIFSADVAFGQLEISPLDSLKEGLGFPQDVAVARDGRIFIADPGKNQVIVFEGGLIPKRRIYLDQPCAVAVSSDGMLYIASNADRSVRILDRNYRIAAYLGRGANEFKQPRNIAVDDITGQIFVVDQLDHCIKIYSSTGEFLETINDSPNLPQDAAIIGHELFVLDQPLTMVSDQAEPIRGGRVKVYDFAADKKSRQFGTYGTGEGQFIGPRGLVADASGNLYITDSFHSVVLCYDKDGNYLGVIGNTSEPMNTPISAAITKENRLYVASSFTGDVRVFDIRVPDNMVQSPKPDIRINDFDRDVLVTGKESVIVTIALDPGDWAGETADWWVTAATPDGWFWYDGDQWIWSAGTVNMQTAPLAYIDVPETIYDGNSLPPGKYTFYFAVDTNMSDTPGRRGLFSDSIELEIIGQP